MHRRTGIWRSVRADSGGLSRGAQASQLRIARVLHDKTTRGILMAGGRARFDVLENFLSGWLVGSLEPAHPTCCVSHCGGEREQQGQSGDHISQPVRHPSSCASSRLRPSLVEAPDPDHSRSYRQDRACLLHRIRTAGSQSMPARVTLDGPSQCHRSCRRLP